jgi:uncharacterized membrane protein
LSHDPQQLSPGAFTIRDGLSDAVRYWEPRRWLYNAALAVVVLVCFSLDARLAWREFTFQTTVLIFICAVLANVAYCAAYLVDVVLQYSAVRESWRGRRWILFAIGTLFAGAITYLVATALFSPGNGN